MSKQKTTKAEPADPTLSPERRSVTRLNEKISQFAVDFTRFLKKIWLPVTLVVGAVLFAYLIYGLVGMIHASNEDELVGRVYELTRSGDSGSKAKELSAEEPELDRLVRDARGADSERYILKRVAQHLMNKVLDTPLDSEDQEALEKHLGTPVGSKQNEPVIKKIEEYARIGQERFPQDADMQTWAKNLIDWARAERAFASKELPKRTFAPVTAPSGASEAPSAGAPAAGAPSAAESGAPSSGATAAPPAPSPAAPAAASGAPATPPPASEAPASFAPLAPAGTAPPGAPAPASPDTGQSGAQPAPGK